VDASPVGYGTGAAIAADQVTGWAPARYALTVVHQAVADADRTLCGKPMTDPEELWQQVGFLDPPCRACALVAARG
jgi:hypothetical protein